MDIAFITWLIFYVCGGDLILARNHFEKVIKKVEP